MKSRRIGSGFGFKLDSGGSDPFAPPGSSGPAAPPGAPPFTPGPTAPPPGPMAPPPGPMAPPPGPIMPGQYPMAPPPSQGSSAWKYLLIGCGVLLLVGGLAVVGTCVYMAKKAPDLMNQGMSGVMGIAKTQYMNELTGDHTAKQKERFSSLYDAVYSDEMTRLGMVQWGQTYRELLTELTEIAGDGQITVAESDKWCDDAYNALESKGYWGDDNE
ncbi:MAG TPA: hypothetical protein VM658_18525 [bacterium]|nr:hypothetical protein [bacterium]